jgi:predicted 3-demethylubiquinone-9 3-methyltransferase (glyoxalase superfamily)
MTRQIPLISHGLWLDNQAEEAVQFYKSVFPDVKVYSTAYYGKEGFEIHGQPEGQVMAINFEIFGTEFQVINGGPVFKMNPSISFFIMCDTDKEAESFWNALVDGGKILMPIDKYEWSERYGWLEDKYGLSWQVYTGAPNDVSQKICPALMFVGAQHGRAEEAISFYTSIFKNSEIQGIMRYPAGGEEPEGTVMHSQFKLGDFVFMAMDSAMEHKFQFNEAVSLIVNCHTQEEIDYYWTKLLDGGHVQECGWLKDKFGVSWQVVPVQLEEMLLDQDQRRVDRVTKAFLHMKKFDIRELEDAFNWK